jgi:7-carboxy-7-deazaguanine synthase
MLSLRESSPVRVRTFPVVEIFGPTIQGEGAEAGIPTHFVRLGGCDYRCSWCDTMYAVDPATVRSESVRMSSQDIAARVRALGGAPQWVALSGGNPALYELQRLVDELHDDGFLVSVETQGSLWRDWLASVDRLTVSPKPPSSGMASERNQQRFRAFMESAQAADMYERTVLKIVCFDEQDVRWAKGTAARYPTVPMMLSAGTPVNREIDVRAAIVARFRWLCERVASDDELASVRVLPQLHVIAWGQARGV